MISEKHYSGAIVANSGIDGNFSSHPISRRTALRTGVLGGIGLATAGLGSSLRASPQSQQYPLLKGNLKQSVVRVFYGMLSLDQFCKAVRRMGLTAIDGGKPEEWAKLKDYGLTCAICGGPWIGFDEVEKHDELEEFYTKRIDIMASLGYRNLLCYAGSLTGNPKGLTREEGMANVEIGLKRILGYAEKKGIVLAVELMNSTISHPGYFCDHTDVGVALCDRIGSPNVRLLYDIYHMQIMEGNIIATIRKYHEYFSHYQTAGVPDRLGLGADQELNYPAICRAIVNTGYEGYLGHEFFPSKPDPITSLREAVQICDV